MYYMTFKKKKYCYTFRNAIVLMSNIAFEIVKLFVVCSLLCLLPGSAETVTCL